VSDPKEQHEDDELELEPETVKDLDVDETNAGQIVGGMTSRSAPLSTAQ